MFRRHSLLIILAALAVVTAKETNAQPTVEAATLLGVVEDPSGARIPGATLILRSDRSPLLKIVESAGRGQFEIAGVPHGSYTLPQQPRDLPMQTLRPWSRHPLPWSSCCGRPP